MHAKGSDGAPIAALAEPGNSNGTAVYNPVLIPQHKLASPASHVCVVGNCATRPDGMGNNVSKLVLGTKAAGIWHGHHSGVHSHFSVLDFITA